MPDLHEEMAVVVFANRKDFFLTKICVSSIRFYYPGIDIFLVKDRLNGNFNSKRLEKAFNVKILDLGKRYYGWSAAKIHFLLKKNLPQKRYMCLDSDIIFIGRVLDRIVHEKGNFVLHADFQQPPFDERAKELYIDPEKVKRWYPDYTYPGFFFNAGQTVVTPGLVTEQLLINSFNPNRYPYYINKDTFQLVDQAVLNAVIPVLCTRSGATVSPLEYMKWSVSFFEDERNGKFDTFKDGASPFLVHYAGDVRERNLSKMKGAELLNVFRQKYYHRLSPLTKFFDKIQDILLSIAAVNKLIYTKNRVLIELHSRIHK